MSVLERQQLLVKQIVAIDDEEILIMLEESLNFHLNKGDDMTDCLSPGELNELKMLAEDDAEENRISHEEFTTFVNKWLSK